MPSYSQRSSSRLETCDKRLQMIFFKLIERGYDNSIVCGYRGVVEQNIAYDAGNSQVQWPDSEHNDMPSRAVDAVPYPTMWDDLPQLYYMAGQVQAIADELHINIRWGGDWDRDYDFEDQEFMDLGHWELVD